MQRIEVECPDCHGAGKVEMVFGLTQAGDTLSRIETCPTCDGFLTVTVTVDNEQAEDD